MKSWQPPESAFGHTQLELWECHSNRAFTFAEIQHSAPIELQRYVHCSEAIKSAVYISCWISERAWKNVMVTNRYKVVQITSESQPKSTPAWGWLLGRVKEKIDSCHKHDEKLWIWHGKCYGQMQYSTAGIRSEVEVFRVDCCGWRNCIKNDMLDRRLLNDGNNVWNVHLIILTHIITLFILRVDFSRSITTIYWESPQDPSRHVFSSFQNLLLLLFPPVWTTPLYHHPRKVEVHGDSKSLGLAGRKLSSCPQTVPETSGPVAKK